jgi:hypothetical protein
MNAEVNGRWTHGGLTVRRDSAALDPLLTLAFGRTEPWPRNAKRRGTVGVANGVALVASNCKAMGLAGTAHPG